MEEVDFFEEVELLATFFEDLDDFDLAFLLDAFLGEATEAVLWEEGVVDLGVGFFMSLIEVDL